ncbi:ATP/GTP-binding protein [Hydrogenimonas sp.]
MIQSHTLDAATMNRFSFDITTSSGDRISLSMYDNRSLSLASESDGRSERFSMSLRHEYGYSFSYRGDGIDAQDQKEIEEAMKAIKPLFEAFVENVKKSGETAGMNELVNTSQAIRRKLPKPHNADTLNFLKKSTVDTMDSVLSLFERDENLLESSKRLFERLFERLDGFEIYA